MRTVVFKFETASTHLAYEIYFVGLRTGILRIKQNRKKTETETLGDVLLHHFWGVEFPVQPAFFSSTFENLCLLYT